jgi:hypothetical protein
MIGFHINVWFLRFPRLLNPCCLCLWPERLISCIYLLCSSLVLYQFTRDFCYDFFYQGLQYQTFFLFLLLTHLVLIIVIWSKGRWLLIVSTYMKTTYVLFNLMIITWYTRGSYIWQYYHKMWRRREKITIFSHKYSIKAAETIQIFPISFFWNIVYTGTLWITSYRPIVTIHSG